MLKGLLTLGTIICLIACTSNNGKYYIKELKKEKSIDSYPDSSFFSEIRCMQYYKDSIYLLDIKRRDIVTLNNNLNKMHIIGSPGPGPGEFNIPFSFYIVQDTLYLLDAGSGSLKVFANNHYVGDYSLKSALDERFTKIGQYFYIACVTDSSSIMRMSKSVNNANPIFVNMGKSHQFKYIKQTYIRNNRIILSDNKFIYAVSDNLHTVEKYDPKTMILLDTFDFSNIPFIKENLNYFSSKNEDDSSYYVTVNDAYIQNHKLYILCATFVPQYEVNTLLEVDTSTTPMTINSIYHLPEDIYNCFCISPSGLLYAFNNKCYLERFKL